MVFDEIGTPSHPLRGDNDLDIGQIGQRVELVEYDQAGALFQAELACRDSLREALAAWCDAIRAAGEQVRRLRDFSQRVDRFEPADKNDD